MLVTEHELERRATAPRVTLEMVNDSISSEHYFTAGEADAYTIQEDTNTWDDVDAAPEPLNCLTFCVLVLKNGFTVTGQSACADPANFQVDIGRRIARANAVTQIWPLLGYELKTKLALLADSTQPSDPHMKTYIGTKVVHATPMCRLTYCIVRGWQMPDDENPLDEGYLIEYADGGLPNFADYAGYVSWSPKAVFDAAYKVIR
jgi:hypothetical protein